MNESSHMLRHTPYVAKLVFVTTLSTLLPASPLSAAEVEFNRDVRPILSDKCFHCHGPDAHNQQSEFRLDSAEHAFADLGGYVAIVAGRPGESELIQRIESDDPDTIMPPSDAPRHLSSDERRVLRQWIKEGGKFDQHWAFARPTKTAVPAGENAIDYFVRKRLEGTTVSPSPRAARHQLLRRVTLDLTGLPPKPEEVEAFLADTSPNAYETVVDRLLGSPAYGERMAQVWLDAARYADTAGYQNDFKRSQWPWRDWVIESYNRNMPFDQFSIEQLAGDLLPNATDSTRLATAFSRNHRINNEGGIIPAEFLVEYVADRVETTSTVWLGLTTGCARCHDHKYDPITMKDFYRFFAFFHNVPEKGKDGSIAPAPKMNVYTRGSREEHEALKNAFAVLQKEEAGYAKVHQTSLQAWSAKQHELLAADAIPAGVGHYSFDFPRGKILANLQQRRLPGRIQGRENYVKSVADARFGKAVSFRSAGHIRLGKLFGNDGYDAASPATWSFFVKMQRNGFGDVLSSQSADSKKCGYQVSLVKTDEQGRLAVAFRLVADDRKARKLEVRTPAVIRQADKSFTHVAVTYDGSLSADGVAIFINGEPAETVVVKDDLSANGFHVVDDHLLGSGLSFATVDELHIHASRLPDGAIRLLSQLDSADVLLARSNRSKEQSAFVERKYFTDHDAGYRILLKDIAAQKKQLDAFERSSITQVSVMDEMVEPRATHLLIRGDYTQPDKSETLSPQTIASLPPMADDLPQNRLGLARWLFQDDNPLTARVAVNRYWQMLFGSGLVKTPEDFGSQGASPSHPQLLDWLAVEFRESGWNVKAMLKRIVMSETYCQDSRTTPMAIEADPDNALLARGARYRLSAFAIRDQALAASGLLSDKIGGPPVMPYQPAGLWEEVSAKGFKYVVAEGEGLYPPQPLHLLASHCSAAEYDELRQRRPRSLHRQRQPHEHATPGNESAKRSAVCRSRTSLGRTHAEGSRCNSGRANQPLQRTGSGPETFFARDERFSIRLL